MKASSESGECASLISTGDFSVFEAVCRAAMGCVFLVLRWASFFPERRSAPRGRRRETNGQGRAHRWDSRGAGPDDFATESLAYWRPGNKHVKSEKATSQVRSPEVLCGSPDRHVGLNA